MPVLGQSVTVSVKVAVVSKGCFAVTVYVWWSTATRGMPWMTQEEKVIDMPEGRLGDTEHCTKPS